MSKFLDKAGLEQFWSGLKTKLSNKVDKISGKGLSTNDYTTTEKNKLSNVREQEYGSFGVYGDTPENVNFSNIKYARLIISGINFADTSNLIIRRTNSSGVQIAKINYGYLEEGLVIEVLNKNIFIWGSDGNLLSASSLSTATSLNFELTTSMSSDSVTFIYKME